MQYTLIVPLPSIADTETTMAAKHEHLYTANISGSIDGLHAHGRRGMSTIVKNKVESFHRKKRSGTQNSHFPTFFWLAFAFWNLQIILCDCDSVSYLYISTFKYLYDTINTNAPVCVTLRSGCSTT